MDVVKRFLHYVSFDTTSDGFSETTPSTPGQKVLGADIVRELKELGLQDPKMDENGYVTAYLPGTGKGAALPALGLISHMDTSASAPGANIHPVPKMVDGEENIATDGTTLLGADDKAGIAEIVTLCEYYLDHPEVSHRPLAVAFTPDEEIGRGTKHFDAEHFPAREAYTVDGGELGDIEYENFNGADVQIKVHGVGVHPGVAKNIMKNAILMAADFISNLPPAETPAHTEGYEGFYHIWKMEGDATEAVIWILIRDHDWNKFQERKTFIERLGAYLNSVYGQGTFEVQMKDRYYNMKKQMEGHMEMIENAKQAFLAAGVTPRVMAIRGGTDGAHLSFMGIPCPNLSTGGLFYHSVSERIPVRALYKMVEVLTYLTKA